MNGRLLTIVSFVIGSLIIIILFNTLTSDQKSLVNFFTLFGTYASLFGIAIAYIQIRSIRSNTEETKLAIENTRQHISQILSVSEISKAIKIIHETQQYIVSSKHELLLLRLKDLKTILIQTKYNQDLLIISQESNYIQLINDLSIDITNIHDLITGTKKGINFSKINQTLEKIENVLTDCENKLKTIKNDI